MSGDKSKRCIKCFNYHVGYYGDLCYSCVQERRNKKDLDESLCRIAAILPDNKIRNKTKK